MIFLGIDPGLQRTGYGVIRQSGNALALVGCGVITSNAADLLPLRLKALAEGVQDVIAQFAPLEAGVEETFVNVNAQSTLKLGQARGAILLALAQANISIHEYAANLVKKSIVGSGHAEKAQVTAMVQMLLPGCGKHGPDAMDALAVAICHAHHRKANAQLAVGSDGAAGYSSMLTGGSKP
jgi:crossover junction endodeoxyribonuclease RuvC